MKAASRSDLPHYLQLTCPDHGSFVVGRTEVHAEESIGQIGGGATLGALVGLVGGPAGILIGGALGALMGANSVENDKERVRRFNSSW